MNKEQQIEYFKNIHLGIDTIIKWSFALNSASAAGLMTFLGNTIDKKKLFADWTLFGDSIFLFIVGMILSIICYLTKVLSVNFQAQLDKHEEGIFRMKPGDYLKMSNRWIIFILITFFILLLSLSSFIGGVLYAKSAVFG